MYQLDASTIIDLWQYLDKQAKLKEEVERRFEMLILDGLKKAAIAIAAAAAEKAEMDRLAKIEAGRLAAAEKAEKAEKDQLAKIAAQTRQLTFSSHTDTYGVFYFIGTKGGTLPYANPHSAGEVVASASSVDAQSIVKDIVGRDNPHNCTKNHTKVDLGVGRSYQGIPRCG